MLSNANKKGQSLQNHFGETFLQVHTMFANLYFGFDVNYKYWPCLRGAFIDKSIFLLNFLKGSSNYRMSEEF